MFTAPAKPRSDTDEKADRKIGIGDKNILIRPAGAFTGSVISRSRGLFTVAAIGSMPPIRTIAPGWKLSPKMCNVFAALLTVRP